MTQTAHTLGPLKIHALEEFVIVDADGARIADVLQSYYDDPAVKAANAEFIVRACNSYYEMLEALKLVSAAIDDLRSQRAFDGGGFDSSKLDEAEQNAARVIAKAEGRS